MRRRTWIHVAQLAVLAVVFAAVAAAGAVGATRVRMAPEGVVHTPTPTIQAYFAAATTSGWAGTVTTPATNITISVDGRPLASTLSTVPGTTADIIATAVVAEPLAEGLHWVVASSSLWTDNWTFEYTADTAAIHPSITDVWPLGDTSRYVWDGKARCAVDPGSIETATAVATITVDGVPFAATYAAPYYCTIANVQATFGVHEATATVTNATGASVSRHWQYVVNVAPNIDSVSPAPLTYSNPTTSAVVAYVSDQVGGIDPSCISMKVNGTTVTAVYESLSATQGVVSYRPSTPYSSDTTVAVELAVSDTYGASATRNWSFGVTNFTDMVVGGVSPNLTCKGCHGSDFNSLHLDQSPISYTMHTYYPGTVPHVLPDQYANCIYCHQTLDTVFNDPGPMTSHQYDNYFEGNIESWTQGKFCMMCHKIQSFQPMSSELFNSNRAWLAHGKSADFTWAGLPAGARIQTPRETMDCTYCHQKGPDQPYAIGPHDSVTDHTVTLDAGCQSGSACHSRVLSREHTAPGRTDAEGRSITCETCHVDGSAAVRAVSGKQWNGGTDRWQTGYSAVGASQARTVELGPWSYQRDGQSVPVTKAKVQIKGSAAAVLYAYYNGTWNQVVTIANRLTNDTSGNVYNPDQTFALTLPGATSFKWSVTTYINGSQMDGIRAGLTVMETNPARPKATCATCHGVTDHRTVHNQSPSNTCAVAGCHEQTNLLDTHATLSCVSCHANTDPTVSGAIAAGNGTCESCHSADGIHVHSDASLEGTETVFAEQCTSCHLVDFVAEHAKPTSSGRDRLCASCHSSADANVSATIAAKVTSCGECHGSWHDDDHPVALDTRCVKCHASDLSKGHAVRDIGCVSCHAQEPALAAVTFSRTACGDCHAIAHTQSFSTSVTPDIYFDPGVEWSPPLAASLFAGETWMPAEAIGSGSVVLGGRVGTTVAGAWSGFADSMRQRGWAVPADPAPGATSFSTTLTRGAQRCRIILYAGDTHESVVGSARGTRCEIVWW